MRLNSDEKLRRANAYRRSTGLSWLELLRRSEQRRHGSDPFNDLPKHQGEHPSAQ